MNLFALPNLSTSTVEPVSILDPPIGNRPAFKDKVEYRKWCNQPQLEHCFLSGQEGVQSRVRISATNQPCKTHALVAEFDAVPPDDWVYRLGGAVLPPTWACRTFSGHCRAWWQLEKPVLFVSRKLWDEFAKIAFKEIKASKLLPGFEEKESLDVAKYYELGNDWVELGGVLPATLVDGWLVRACSKMDWRKEGPAVPVEKIREEGERRFPGRWPGGWDTFQFGARGVRFWADGDANSVIAVESGCVCFTGDAPFVSWSAIFGSDWVRRSTDDMIGQAIAGIYYDASSRVYWSNGTACGWISIGIDDCRRRLADRGISTSCPKGSTISDADKAILAIQRVRCIDGSFPAFFRPEEVVQCNQRRLLNTSRLTLLPPDPAVKVWPDGFPWIGEFLWMLFGDDQLDYYLAWLSHFYKSCLAGKPARGLFLFLAGPTGCGKTFLNNVIHRQIFGACEEATAYLTGDDQFNSQLFSAPIWTVDDAIASSSSKSNNRFSQAVKAIAANDEFTMRAMYREGIRMPWTGRLVCTMNDDPESLRMLPSTELNLLDKIMLLKANTTFAEFPDDEFVLSELPSFCSFLRDLPRSGPAWTGGRFGIFPYHDPRLKQASEDSQDSTSASELIATWAKSYFSPEGPGAKDDEWRGNPTDLLRAFAGFDDVQQLASKLAPNAVYMGRYLNKLINRGDKGISFRRTPYSREYRISRSVVPPMTATP